MTTRRRVGFINNISEASRRQLMQPVQCWEKVWTLPEGAAPGSTFKVFKWVKTDKVQQFSDDEEEADEPLAPIQLEDIEVVDGDEEMEQDQEEATASIAADATPAPMSRDVSAPPGSKTEPTSPKPHPLSVSFQPPTPTPGPDDQVEDLADPLGGDGSGLELGDLGVGEGLGDDLGDGLGDMSLDMAGMGPDGEAFEGAGDMSQLQADDPLLGGPIMDDVVGDPFAVPQP